MTDGDDYDGYVTDAPIAEARDDRFGRARWARRIAHTIAAQRDPASIVVGVYGPWGDGKTSVLNMLAAALRDTDGVVPVRFNPWRLGDEAEMLRGFFATLADALDEQLPTTKEKVGKVLRTYGALLKPVPVAGGALEGVAGALGAALSETNLARERLRVEALLAEHATRVVILIDDLDRLDKAEIQAMFRLVKVAADFAHTAYVLAFDHAVVADALAERYAAGSDHGASFMDKIIQLPLHLPPVSPELLRRLALEAVDIALNQAEVQLSDADAGAFVSAFDRTVAPRLATPRAAKRYGNALLFALPMIGDEVHPVDLMLVEAMRVCYPRLYEWVRGHQRLVLGPHRAAAGADHPDLDPLRTGVAQATAGLSDDDAARARTLLTTLFPRTESAWQNRTWGSDWEAPWAKDKRIASALYFHRYFTYDVPPGDVRDADLDALIARLGEPDADVADIAHSAVAAFDALDPGGVLRKLASRAASADATTAARLAHVLAACSDRLSDVGGFLGLSALERAAMLVRDLIGQVPRDDRANLILDLFREGQHLPFLIHLIGWLRPQADAPERAVVTAAECDRAGQVLAGRLLTLWRSGGAFRTLGSTIGASLHVCAIYGDRSALQDCLQRLINDDFGAAFALMRAFLGRAWNENCVPVVPDFRREEYDALADYVDPTLLFTRLQERFGQDVGADDTTDPARLGPDERLAHQYARIHRAVPPPQPPTENG